MTDRQAASCYGVVAASLVALGLLILDYPSDQNLFLALGMGIIVGIGSWLYLKRR